MQLQLGSDPWPGNCICCGAAKKEEKKQKICLNAMNVNTKEELPGTQGRPGHSLGHTAHPGSLAALSEGPHPHPVTQSVRAFVWLWVIFLPESQAHFRSQLSGALWDHLSTPILNLPHFKSSLKLEASPIVVKYHRIYSTHYKPSNFPFFLL